MVKIVDGKKIADEVIEKIRRKIDKEKLKLRISVVLVGKDPISLIYVSQKKKACQRCGIDFSLYQFPKKVLEKDLCEKIKEIDKESSGVIIQLPLHSKLNVQKILNAVSEKKDIDFLSEINSNKFYNGDFSVLPPVVGAVNYIFKENKISFKGKKIVLVGYGRLVGKPLSFWFAFQGVTVLIIDKMISDILLPTQKADILISGVGKPNLIKENMVKKGVIAIDVGSSFQKGRIVGDFDKSVFKKASIITPVPGGVGPITTACLIENLVKFNLKN